MGDRCGEVGTNEALIHAISGFPGRWVSVVKRSLHIARNLFGTTRGGQKRKKESKVLRSAGFNARPCTCERAEKEKIAHIAHSGIN